MSRLAFSSLALVNTKAFLLGLLIYFWDSYFEAVIFAALTKCIAILLLAIVALATFTQCCIGDNCAQEQATATSSHPDEGGDDGACSPFSSCTTCAGFTTQVPSIQVEELPASKLQHRSIETGFFLPSLLFSFWQPPRMASVHC